MLFALMSWSPKEQQTHFDKTFIEGMFFLDGDALARAVLQHWTEGQKYPMIAFPSGLEFALWETDTPDKHRVHLFGEMDLLLESNREEGLQHASRIAEQVGYAVGPVGEHQLEVIGHDRDEQLRITYDPARHRISNVELLRTPYERPKHPAHVLMTDDLRQQLPPLYHGEEIGLEAKALVKYFLPGTQWTWYASEFDGQDLFFGLVVGYAVELGYFSLSELQALSEESPLLLPVERDLHYEPRTLEELIQYHQQA